MLEKKKKTKVDIVDIKRHDGALMLPAGLSYAAARKVLLEQERYENEIIDVERTFEYFVWDGAIAFLRAIEQKFGYVHGKTKMTFFGPDRPKLVTINTSVDETTQVPWGSFVVPGFDNDLGEELSTGSAMSDGRTVFRARGILRRRNEPIFNALCDLTEKILRTESIYKGKAIRIKFRDKNGKPLNLPEPKFLNCRNVDPDGLIFSKDIENAIETSVFTPIQKTGFCIKNRVPLKRGILLSGSYGTGKTLTAYSTAAKCEKNNWTFLYAESVQDLTDVILFARQYEPAVVFCEDIDRRVGETRTIDIDEVLNTVDGLTTKSSQIMTILTTNHIENINEALLRPGRLDAVINLGFPDQEAVERLLRFYAQKEIPEDEDLTEVCKLLEGKIPAFVREVIERTKLVCIRESSDGKIQLSGEHLKIAAMGMQSHFALLEREKSEEGSQLEAGMMEIVRRAMSDDVDINTIIEKVKQEIPCLQDREPCLRDQD
jgi:transitional endoplasmic reticulum ATPase